MHGLADIRAINNAVLNDEVARRARVAKNAAYNNELAEATNLVWHCRNPEYRMDAQQLNAIADLLVSAYGIQED